MSSTNIHAQTNKSDKGIALILIDIQNDYFTGGAMPLAGAEEAGDKAGLVLNKFREEGLPVIHIRHIAHDPRATFFIADTQGAEINHRVKPANNEVVIVKHTPNSFVGTDLLAHLQAKGITRLVIAGMMTHMCVDATTRAAKDYGFDCTLIGDACATCDQQAGDRSVKAEDVQTAFLSALGYYYSQVMDADSFLAE